jgi:AraC-like DNA-binding protein
MLSRNAALPARYFSFVLSYTAELGLPARALMRAAGLTRAQVAARDALLPLSRFNELIQAVIAATGRTDLGFDLGERVTYHLHDTLGDALEHCRDLDQALRLCSRYFPFITPSYLMEYHRGPRVARVCFRPTVAMPHETLAVLSETHAVSFHRLGLGATPRRIPPYALRMPMPRPAHAPRYRVLSPARVTFEPGALPEVRIEIPSDFMDSAFTLHDPNRVTERQTQLDRALQDAIDTGHYGDWLKMLLLHAEGCQLTLADAASALHLTPRTLARRLAAEGIEFRALANEVRMQRAMDMLATSDAPIATVAARLGYGHTSNFTVAFRARNGVSPRQYRQSTRNRAPGPSG